MSARSNASTISNSSSTKQHHHPASMMVSSSSTDPLLAAATATAAYTATMPGGADGEIGTFSTITPLGTTSPTTGAAAVPLYHSRSRGRGGGLLGGGGAGAAGNFFSRNSANSSQSHSTTTSSSSPRGWIRTILLIQAIMASFFILLRQQALMPNIINSGSIYNDKLHEQLLPHMIMVGSSSSSGSTTNSNMMNPTLLTSMNQTTSSSSSFDQQPVKEMDLNPLAVPVGSIRNLVSLRVSDTHLSNQRSIYGGHGDKKHLGGFTSYDGQGISPNVWRNMITHYGIHSILDVGCGRGLSSLWFMIHGVDTLCVEGSHDAIDKSVLPRSDGISQSMIIEHDYTRGPWWPSKTYDAIWCVEFVEHVSRHYHTHYIPTFRKAALIFMTSSDHGGWHHTEIHNDDWWIMKMESYGFRYSSKLTDQVKLWAYEEALRNETGPNGQYYNGQHIYVSIKVFINPVVAALSQHMHLFPEPGCYSHPDPSNPRKTITRECGQGHGREILLETPLDQSFLPLKIQPEMDQLWVGMIQAFLHPEMKAAMEAAAAAAAAATSTTSATNNNNAIEAAPTTKAAVVAAVTGNTKDQNKQLQQQQQQKKMESVVSKPNTNQEAKPTVVNSLAFNSSTGNDHPVVLYRSGKLKKDKLPSRIPVVAWPYVEFGIQTAESMHIQENGVSESNYLHLSMNLSNYDPNVVWVGDVGFPNVGYHPSCTKIADLAQQAQQNRSQLGLTLHWPVFVVDFTDGSAYPRCEPLEKVVGRNMVWYFRRSIVSGRHWVNNSGWVQTGHLDSLQHDGTVYHHAPLIARTDTVKAIQDVLATKYNKKLGDAIETLPRTGTDVIYFWPRDGATGIANGDTAQLRRRVGEVIHEMGQKDGINVSVGLVGQTAVRGRRGVMLAYVEAMLNSKIVVVVQRDGWEDHYRLFEAVLTGALVMTDRMLSLPAGLKNGTSIVEFTSADDLRTKILYYLKHDQVRREIGRQGRLVAMLQHRTWHRIEEIIFGRPLSTCDHAKPGSPCPWIVHANETLVAATSKEVMKPPSSDKKQPLPDQPKSTSTSDSDHPVIRFRAGKIKQDQLPKIPVVAWPYSEFGIQTAESMHIEENGISESKYLQLSVNISNYDPNVVWVGDVGFPNVGYNPSCTKLADLAKQAQQNRSKLGLVLNWPVFMVDFTDGAQYPRCKPVEDVVGRNLVWYFRRSIVGGRHWEDKSAWVQTGQLQNMKHEGTDYYHAPLIARTDTVKTIQDVLATKYKMKLGDAIERLPRNGTDVINFWPRDAKDDSANLRHQVGEVIYEMGQKDKIKVFVGLAGETAVVGRRGVMSAYVEAMLDSKIVVVVQRDEWEDHYRLFEAVLSGAMVMTDRMLSLPSGLKNGTSIVEFTSADDLRAKILYYLKHDQERQEIGRQGRLVAMLQHRTWHRIEEIIFGRSLATCEQAKPGSPCPWIVHANETRRRRR